MKTSTVASKNAPGARISSRPPTNAVTVNCSPEDIRKKAFELSAEHRSYDDYIWLLAESELKVSKACLEASGKPGDAIKMDASRIVDKVDEKEIRQLAEKYAKAHPKVQDLHWYIAERQCALEGAKRGK